MTYEAFQTYKVDICTDTAFGKQQFQRKKGGVPARFLQILKQLEITIWSNFQSCRTRDKKGVANVGISTAKLILSLFSPIALAHIAVSRKAFTYCTVYFTPQDAHNTVTTTRKSKGIQEPPVCQNKHAVQQRTSKSLHIFSLHRIVYYKNRTAKRGKEKKKSPGSSPPLSFMHIFAPILKNKLWRERERATIFLLLQSLFFQPLPLSNAHSAFKSHFK